MLGRAGGQPKVFAQRRRRANRTAASTTTQPLRALRRSPIASATLVQAAKAMDARNVRARRTAVITDLLPDTFLGLLLGKAEALCAVLSPPQEYIMPALGPEAMRPRALRRTARDQNLRNFPLRVPRALVYIIPELIRPFKTFPPKWRSRSLDVAWARLSELDR